MNFWDKITGNDMTKEFKKLELRAKKLPDDYKDAWEKIKENTWLHSDFTGRNLMPILEEALDMLEETALSGQSAQEALGEDIKGVCEELIGKENANTYRDKWRKQLNSNIAKKLGK